MLEVGAWGQSRTEYRLGLKKDKRRKMCMCNYTCVTDCVFQRASCYSHLCIFPSCTVPGLACVTSSIGKKWCYVTFEIRFNKALHLPSWLHSFSLGGQLLGQSSPCRGPCVKEWRPLADTCVLELGDRTSSPIQPSHDSPSWEVLSWNNPIHRSLTLKNDMS